MNLIPIAPKDTQVLAAYNAAKNAGNDYALKALISGQLMLEYREHLRRTSHSGKSSIHGRNQHNEDAGFLDFLAANEIPKTSAYRHMTAAERVARAGLGIPMHKEFSSVIEIEGAQPMSCSMALTAPEKNLPEEARAFRQAIFDFMADHTLAEAALAVADGESDGKRITLAKGGKSKGGKGKGDRKAFDEFAKTKLKHLTTFLGHKLTTSQKSQIVVAFDTALETWPRWIIEGIAEKCRTELKLAESERAARSTFEN